MLQLPIPSVFTRRASIGTPGRSSLCRRAARTRDPHCRYHATHTFGFRYGMLCQGVHRPHHCCLCFLSSCVVCGIALHLRGEQKVVAPSYGDPSAALIWLQQVPENGIATCCLRLSSGALVSAVLITALLILQTSPQLSLPPAGWGLSKENRIQLLHAAAFNVWRNLLQQQVY